MNDSRTTTGLEKVYLLRSAPTSPMAPWSFGRGEYLMDMRGVPYLKALFNINHIFYW